MSARPGTAHDDLMDLGSRWSYESLTEFQVVRVNGKRFTVEHVEIDRVTGLDAYTFRNDATGELTIGFQGTDGALDILADATLITSLTPAQYAAADRYVDAVERKLGPVSSVCGNSLGGGLAAHVATTRPYLQAVTVNPAPVPRGAPRPEAPNRRHRSRKTARRLGRLAVALAVITGGCMPPDADPTPDDTPVLVTIDDREALGYDQPEGKRNPELQALANANRDQIYAIVQPYLRRTLHRDVELTGINAYHPSLMVQVTWRTLDEPYVAGAEDVRLQPDGTLISEAYIGPSLTAVEAETVSGILAMAYRDEIDAMRDHLLTTHPEFGGGLPPGYMNLTRRADPLFDLSPGKLLPGGGKDPARSHQASNSIYAAFLADPERSHLEWRKLVDKLTAGVPLNVGVHLVLADPGTELTEQLARRVGDDIRENPAFHRFDEWTVFTYSNLIGRESNDFHRSFTMTADKSEDDWWITEWRDGATVR